MFKIYRSSFSFSKVFLRKLSSFKPSLYQNYIFIEWFEKLIGDNVKIIIDENIDVPCKVNTEENEHIVLHINPFHKYISNLIEMINYNPVSPGQLAEDLAIIYFEGACLEAGFKIERFKNFNERLHRCLKSNELTPSFKFIKSEDAEKVNVVGSFSAKILLEGKDTNDKITVFEIFMKKGESGPLHYHEVDIENFFIIDGKMQFTVQDKEFIATKGDILMAGQYIKRGFSALEDTRLLVFNLPSDPSENQMRNVASLKPGEKLSQEIVEKMKELKIHTLEPFRAETLNKI